MGFIRGENAIERYSEEYGEAYEIKCPRCGGESFVIASGNTAVCADCRRAIELVGGLSEWEMYRCGEALRGRVRLAAGIARYNRGQAVYVAARLRDGFLPLGECEDIRAGALGDIYAVVYADTAEDNAPPFGGDIPELEAEIALRFESCEPYRAISELLGGGEVTRLVCAACSYKKFSVIDGDAVCGRCGTPQGLSGLSRGQHAEFEIYRGENGAFVGDTGWGDTEPFHV